MLVVVDELCDGVEIMFLCQVKLSLCGGADVIMSAASTRFPVVNITKATFSRFSQQVFIYTETRCLLCMHEQVISPLCYPLCGSVLNEKVLQED